MVRVYLNTLQDKMFDYKECVFSSITKFFQPSNESEGVFAFQNKEIMDKAKKYLISYEKIETKKIIQGKSHLIFTNELEKPFTKAYDKMDTTLDNLIKHLEQNLDKTLDQIDKAFVEWEFYNECEERIINRVLKQTFQLELKGVEKYIVVKILKKVANEGDPLTGPELRKIFHGINQKRLILYRYIN